MSGFDLEVYISKKNKNKFKVPGNKKVVPVYPPSFPLSGKIRIEECVASFFTNGSWTPSTKLKNGLFTTSFSRTVNRLRRGDLVEIKMKVRGEDGISYPLQGTVKIR